MDWQTLREQYDRDGYLVFPHVLDADLIRAAGEHVEWLQRKNPDVRPEALHHHLMWDDPFWIRLVADSRLLDLVEPIIGPDIALFASHYICKPGGDGLPVLWHQDGSYWPLDPMEVVTGWLAVDDSTAENGCMRVIPGSHVGHRDLGQRPSDTPDLIQSQPFELAPEVVDESRAVDVTMRRGDLSLHDSYIIHGSEPNHSPNRRAALTVRYIPASARIQDTSDRRQYLVRGEAADNGNVYYEPPR